MELVDESHGAIAQRTPCGLIEGVDILAADGHTASRRAIEPPRICSSVVFPEPDAPTIAMHSPLAMTRSKPSSTVSVEPPSLKSRPKPRASNTAWSVMSQSLCGLSSCGPPCRIQGGERAQDESHAGHLQHIEPRDMSRQIAHEIHLGVEELDTE